MNFSDPYINAMFSAARKASKGLLRDFGEVEKLQVSLKGVSDFVSKADTQSERVLIKELSYLYPKFNILAEEKGQPGERYILGNKNMSLKEILLAKKLFLYLDYLLVHQVLKNLDFQIMPVIVILLLSY